MHEMQEQQGEPLYTLKEAASEFRVAESTVWRWVDKGLIPAYRLPGRRIRLKKSDVEKAIRPAARPAAEWEKWIVGETGIGVDPEVAIARSLEHMARVRARRGGEPLPDSVEDIRQMREERSREMDNW